MSTKKYFFILLFFLPILSAAQSTDTIQNIDTIKHTEPRLSYVFTPQAIANSDLFCFQGSNLKWMETKITIFNRWGSKVFEATNLKNCWNGKINNRGEICNQGTYFFILSYKTNTGDMKTLQGLITLLRN